jgi:hypothetical protein
MKPEQIQRDLFDNGFSQEGLNALYAARGYQEAPTLPTSLVGTKQGAGRAKIFLFDQANKRRTPSKDEQDFLNFYGQTAIDPFNKQSGISKVAGGVLEVASMAFPALAKMKAVADIGNAALAKPPKAPATGTQPVTGLGAPAGTAAAQFSLEAALSPRMKARLAKRSVEMGRAGI